MSAIWQEQLDVVTEFAGWSDDELFAAWVQRTRVLRGLDPDPVTGQFRTIPPVTAPRGVWTAMVRDLAHAIRQAYLAIDTPAPADPEFCRLFLGAFGGVTSDSLRYRAEGEGAELPLPPRSFDDGATAEERVRLQRVDELREQRRRGQAAQRSWHSVWSGATFSGAGGEPSVVSTLRTWIDWSGELQARSLDSADAFLRRGGDIGAHRWSGEPLVPAAGERVTSPWTGGDLFVRHECALRMDFGDCTRWADEVLPAPAMEWQLWSEIADALDRRSATDVMRDAWRWTTARNVAQLLASGLATTEVTDMIGQADIDAARIQGENDIREIARWTSIVGDAAMVAGPYGAIVGTVLKGIAALLEAIPIAHGEGLDVWERRTPAFSTHRLTGRPGRAPTQAVELPQGFGRALRGRLQIMFPVLDATRLRVRVGGGVWRPHHWEDDVPVGAYEVDVEQPGRVPSRVTARVLAGELTVVQLQPLQRVQTNTERERQIADADADAETERLRLEKVRERVEARREADKVRDEKLRQVEAEEGRRKKVPVKPTPVETKPPPLEVEPAPEVTPEVAEGDQTETETDGVDESHRAPPSSAGRWLRRGVAAVGLSMFGYAAWRAVSWTRRTVDVGLPMDQGTHDLVPAPRDAGRARAGARARMDRNR